MYGLKMLKFKEVSEGYLKFDVAILGNFFFGKFREITINFHIFKCKIHYYEEKCIYLSYENTWVTMA